MTIIIIMDDKNAICTRENAEQNLSFDEKRDFNKNKTNRCRPSLTESNVIFGAPGNVKLSKKSTTTVYAARRLH